MIAIKLAGNWFTEQRNYLIKGNYEKERLFIFDKLFKTGVMKKLIIIYSIIYLCFSFIISQKLSVKPD